MIKVTNEFKKTVYAPIRTTNAYVSFEIFDDQAYGDSNKKVSSMAKVSRLDELTNKDRSQTHKYATLERNYLKLDGSFFLVSNNDTEEDMEVGWWSDNLSDKNGNFIGNEFIELDFTETHNSMGLTITFDVMNKEYAVDFDINIISNSGEVIHKEEVRDNNKCIYTLEKGLDNYKKIKVTIKKWCKAFRRARIVEIDFGVIRVYEGDTLINLKVIEEIDTLSSTLPANEIQFTVDNQSREFNILNREGFYRFLAERQKIKATIGMELEEDIYEEIEVGTYYLTDWKSNEGALTTTFTARDIFEIIMNKEYKNSLRNTNMYSLAEDILKKANVEDYRVDDKLKNIKTKGFFEKINSRQALQSIGMASKSIIYQDRQGVLQIKQLDTIDAEGSEHIYYASDNLYAGTFSPTVKNDYGMRKITFDNIYDEPQIELNDLLHKINISVFNSKEDSTEHIFYNGKVDEGISLELKNPLINTKAHADEVAKWIISEYNLRAKYTVNWRQNPALEVGDIVLVEDSYDESRLSRITKQEFNFNGALSGRSTTKGGV